MPDPAEPTGPRRPRLPLWAARALLALGIPAALLLAAEGALRVAGYGRPTAFMIPDAEEGYLRTNPEFASRFVPGSFDLRPLNFRMAAHKAPNTVRIVVLGESAAQGVPVPSFGFAPQLRAQLRSRYPGREFEVINTGIVAVNSHVVYEVAREMAAFEPDIFLVYMGNNEVVGPYGPGCAYLSQMPPLWLIRLSVFVRSTRTGQLLGALAARLSPAGRHPREWGGMSMFVDNAVAGDDPRLEAVYGNFRENLEGIVGAASGAGARTVLCTVVANLKDCPPFVSMHSPWLSAAALGVWRGVFERGRLSWMLGEDDRARAFLAEALRIDPMYAETHYMLGSIDLRSGRVDAARREFADALHWDALRFRPDPRINSIIREVAAGAGDRVVLVDTAMALGADPDSAATPSGRELLFEHVHFDWEGNYRAAILMARGCARADLGGDPGETGWLDRQGCAAALAYTGHERLPMLLRIDVLIRKPPFTNQLTHVADEARMAREIGDAAREARDPETISRSLATAKEALLNDPENPALAGILEGVEIDAGDLGGALALARRAAELVPGDPALAADEAGILIRLGRTEEAQRTLMAAAASGADEGILTPVLSELWSRNRYYDEGIAYLDGALASRPRDTGLRTVQAGLRLARGDAAGAEREFREVLADDPSSDGALEGLVDLLSRSGRKDAASSESLAFADRQPRNQANSLRAASACDALGDAEGSVHHLLAAERSGPVTSTFELTLALKLLQLRRIGEMMNHLALARILSLDEGNPSVTGSIDALIAKMRPMAEAEAAPGGG
jgi:Flp pilus assembly protein TadD